MKESYLKKAAGCYDWEAMQTLNLERLCLQKIPDEFTFCSSLCKLYLPRNEIKEISSLEFLCGTRKFLKEWDV